MEGLLQDPFPVDEVIAAARRVRNNSGVLGVLKPQLLKAGLAELAPALAALFRACVVIQRLPHIWAMSAITAIPKAGADFRSCDGYRGIAVGTLPAKIYASTLNSRLMGFTEAGDLRADGQFGFRRGRGCPHAAFVLRTLIEQARAGDQRLFVNFVDFRKAYDCIPRHLLWAKLERRGINGWVLQAVMALYGSVPMCVKTAAGYSGVFPSTMGVKQGCPLSPLLFGIYIDDLEGEMMAAHTAEQEAAGALDLPLLQGKPVPGMSYADDLGQVSTSAAGLRRQAALLFDYAKRWGLTINAKKTKVVVFGRTRSTAQESTVQLYFGDEEVEVVPEFTYLGILFKAGGNFSAAMDLRVGAGKRAWHGMQRRLKELRLESADIQFRMFDALVVPVLSYGMEIWAPLMLCQPALTSPCERVHVAHLRRVMGLRKSTANCIVLAEAGRLPLICSWIRRMTRFYNRLAAAAADSILGRAFATSLELARGDRQRPAISWAGEFAEALKTFGVEVDLEQPSSLCRQEISLQCTRHYLQKTRAQQGRKIAYYTHVVRGGLPDAEYKTPEYLVTAERRAQTRALCQLRTGSHWLREETGRWVKPVKLKREERLCTHCEGLEEKVEVMEDLEHMLFTCPGQAKIRERFPQLFAETAENRGVCAFFQQSPMALAAFATACYKQNEIRREEIRTGVG